MLSREKYYSIIKTTTLTSVDLIPYYDGKILLGFRKNKPAQGTWFTPGCRTGKGETQKMAVERVAKTELGLDINFNDVTLLGVYDHIYNDNFKDELFGTHYVDIAYFWPLKELPNIKLDEQHDDMIWLSLKKLMQNRYVHPYVKLYVNDIKRLLTKTTT